MFLGKNYGSGGGRMNVSGETARMIDEEVRGIIDECYETAERLLRENRDKLDLMSDALMQYETIDTDQIDDIMEGKKPRPPKESSGSSSNGDGGAGIKAEEAPEASESKGTDSDDEKKGPIGGPAGEH